MREAGAARGVAVKGRASSRPRAKSRATVLIPSRLHPGRERFAIRRDRKGDHLSCLICDSIGCVRWKLHDRWADPRGGLDGTAACDRCAAVRDPGWWRSASAAAFRREAIACMGELEDALVKDEWSAADGLSCDVVAAAELLRIIADGLVIDETLAGRG